MHIYDPSYYQYINAGARRSAEQLLPLIVQSLHVRSVVDFGAGQCVWLSVWRMLGVTDVMGVDGEYVEPSCLLVRPEQFQPVDLTKPISLGRTFDLVQSLEVAEHLPAEAAETFVDNLVAHGSMVLFSAAVPGQGGEYHVNERPHEYWRLLFRARGFSIFDAIRPKLRMNASVERWYRYNTFLYVRDTQVFRLPSEIQALRVHDERDICDVSPFHYRMRKMFVRCLPSAAVSQLAIAKKRLHNHLTGRRA